MAGEAAAAGEGGGGEVVAVFAAGVAGVGEPDLLHGKCEL